jgi:hemin uptake protein HemP
MSLIADSIMDASSIVSETSPDKRKFTMLDWSKPIPSDVLFSEGDEVLIQHQGAQYRLRRTPDGKLILSK